jgi:subtilisin
MRRRFAALAAAAALLLSSVGGAASVEPDASAGPAPIIEPSPSVEPTPVVAPAPDPRSSADPSIDVRGRPVHPGVAPDGPVIAPVIKAIRPAEGPAGAHRTRAATDPTDRWIVVLKSGTDVSSAVERQGKRLGFATDRTYRNALRGYSATLDRGQVTALSQDPTVALIVADEKIEAEGQLIPTGISRVSATISPVAKIDGLDERVDADVAIVDTGITRVADLNVAGGYNCSTTNRAAWRDVYGHGTHVAGTVGALDNGNGVVGVAPGVRLWAVKILNDSGEGLLSWYVCGLDWIAAQRDPVDPARPLFEAVNMSVTKWGSDDGNCGFTNKDILHKAICRLVASGVTVVAAAANDAGSASKRVPAAYNEVITVSALADTDGKPGGLGGHRCYSWGSYDADDTFANFSNHGSDVDLIAPGKCIWSTIPGGYQYMSGTSMAAPHVTGAAALLKADRPGLTPAEVKEALQYLGNLNWKTSTDPDSVHEKLLDVSKIGPRGDFTMAVGPDAVVGVGGGPARFPITLTRSATSFERVRLSATDLPAGATASFAPSSLYGFAGVATTLTVMVPVGLDPGFYRFTVSADEHGNVQTAAATIRVRTDIPTAQPPTTAAQTNTILGATTLPIRVSWPAGTDPSTGIAGYELESSVDDGPWHALAATSGTVRSATAVQDLGRAYRYRVRAQDTVGNWSPWAEGPSGTAVLVQDRATSITYSGTWKKAVYVYASGGTTTYATSSTARARTTFSGRGVALVAPVGPTRGSATIYIDGVSRLKVSFRASGGNSRVVMYATTFATLGTHTIEVRLAGNGRVDIDAFVILR